MRLDEEKALRLRRTQLQAELARINVLLDDAPKVDTREQFYRDAENDFRNAGPNGNYE